MNKNELFRHTADWFEGEDFENLLVDETEQKILVPVSNEASYWLIRVALNEAPLAVLLHQSLPLCIPEERRSDAALLACELNARMTLGSFRVDPADGEFCVQTNAPLFSEPAPEMMPEVIGQIVVPSMAGFGACIQTFTHFAVGAIDRHACLATLLGGNDAEKALTWSSRGIRPEWN